MLPIPKLQLRLTHHYPKTFINKPNILSIRNITFFNINALTKSPLKLKNVVCISYSSKIFHHEGIKNFSSKTTSTDELTRNDEIRALRLILGQKKYKDFTQEEKDLVDRYQESLLKVDGGMILPNTQRSMEQEQFELLLTKLPKIKD